MSRKLRNVTNRWLEAERSGIDPEAESALARVFRVLPVPSPGSQFAVRTLEQLALATRATRKPHWAFRWAVAVALALSGGTTALYAPALVSSLSVRGAFNWLVDLSAGILATMFRFLANGFTFLEVVARAGATSAEVMATPQTLGLMLAIVLFGLATFRVLAGLVAVERSSYHA